MTPRGALPTTGQTTHQFHGGPGASGIWARKACGSLGGSVLDVGGRRDERRSEAGRWLAVTTALAVSRLQAHACAMLLQVCGRRGLLQWGTELSCAAVRPSAERHADYRRPPRHSKLVCQSKAARFEQWVMQPAQTDEVRQLTARVGTVSPAGNVARHQQLRIGYVAQRASMAVVLQRGAGYGSHAASCSRLTDRLECAGIGQHERAAKGGMIEHVVGKVLADGVDHCATNDVRHRCRKRRVCPRRSAPAARG